MSGISLMVKQAVKDASQVFHFAAQVAVTSSLVDPIEDFEINARGTLNLLEAVRARQKIRRRSCLRLPTRSTGTSPISSLVKKALGTRLSKRLIRERGINEERPLDFIALMAARKARPINM